jgi:hypothetical protein
MGDLCEFGIAGVCFCSNTRVTLYALAGSFGEMRICDPPAGVKKVGVLEEDHPFVE